MIDLRLGDCLEILPTLPDKSVDAIITDLPYGTTACSWDVVIPFEPMWKEVKRICKGAFVTTASQPFTSLLIMSNLDWFRYCCVWEKTRSTGFLDARKKPMKRHEDIVVFSQNRHTYNPQTSIAPPERIDKRKTINNGMIPEGGVYNNSRAFVKIRNKDNGLRFPTSVFEFANPNNDLDHPTQKPVALYEYLIKTYTNPGDTVLDFCAGSGTTGVAAIRTGRNAILIEKKPEYFAIMERRTAEEQQMELV
jgi:site-specific DNA-methyltransferase (adenine-specific)